MIAWRRSSSDSTPLIEPNRNRLRSPVYDACRVDMITTASARNPTNRIPIDASSGSGECERTTLIPPTIAAAAISAPTVVLCPSRNAMAIPGRTPCASASPRNVRPRSTTHVPTIEVVMAVRRPPHSARCMNGLSANGVIHHPHGSVSTRIGAPASLAEAAGDQPGVGAKQLRVRLCSGPGRSEGVREEADDANVAHLGCERLDVLRRMLLFREHRADAGPFDDLGQLLQLSRVRLTE